MDLGGAPGIGFAAAAAAALSIGECRGEAPGVSDAVPTLADALTN